MSTARFWERCKLLKGRQEVEEAKSSESGGIFKLGLGFSGNLRDVS